MSTVQRGRNSWRRDLWRGMGESGWVEGIVAICLVVAYLPDLASRTPIHLLLGIVAFALAGSGGRWPVLAAVAILIVGVARWTGVEIGVVGVATLLAVEALGTVGRCPWTVLAVLAAGAAWFSQSPDPAAAWQDYALTTILLALVGGVGMLRHRVKTVRATAAADIAAQQKTRERIARELHDTVARNLTEITFLADESLASPPDHPDESLRRIAQLATSSVDDMRAALETLRGTGAIEDTRARASTLADLTRIGAEAARATIELQRLGFKVDSAVASPPGPVLELVVEETVIEALAELTANVVRHGASYCQIVVAMQAKTLRVSVTNGIAEEGTDVASTRQGLVGVRELAHAVGGKIDAGHLTGDTWRAEVTVPLALSDERTSGG